MKKITIQDLMIYEQKLKEVSKEDLHEQLWSLKKLIHICKHEIVKRKHAQLSAQNKEKQNA